MIITRFAPSPTGYLHIGNLRTALFNYLIARRAGGKFILRLDDTDPERSSSVYSDAIKQDLEWLGLLWDKAEHQSDRISLYQEGAEKLRACGRLYEAFETPIELELKRKKQLNMGKPPIYDRGVRALSYAERARLKKERAEHWRFLLDHTRIEWEDTILGTRSIDAASVSDPVLIRGDGQFLYTLASVIDDGEMGITHVVRGADHITNTATQIQIMQALGYHPPVFAHHSLLEGFGGKIFSKRLGTFSLRDLREAGVQPMALLSYLARLGSSLPVVLRPNLSEIADAFELTEFGLAPTKFNHNDLYPLTARYLAHLEYEQVATEIAAFGISDEKAQDFWEAVRENITTLNDLPQWWKICKEGADPLIDVGDGDFVKAAIELLPKGELDHESWKEWTDIVKKTTGRKGKTLFQPLRKALTGRDFGPNMAKLLPLLQKIRLKY